jgi:hypothetical protein
VNAPQPPPRPPFNDQLQQALSPVQQVVNQRAKVEQIMRKYGRPLPKEMPKAPVGNQWEGDPNA